MHLNSIASFHLQIQVFEGLKNVCCHEKIRIEIKVWDKASPSIQSYSDTHTQCLSALVWSALIGKTKHLPCVVPRYTR